MINCISNNYVCGFSSNTVKTPINRQKIRVFNTIPLLLYLVLPNHQSKAVSPILITGKLLYISLQLYFCFVHSLLYLWFSPAALRHSCAVQASRTCALVNNNMHAGHGQGTPTWLWKLSSITSSNTRPRVIFKNARNSFDKFVVLAM